MSDDPAVLSLAIQKAVNAACEEFEAAWNANDPRPIEYVLVGWTGHERSALLAELIALEIELRCRRQETPCLSEYSERFESDRSLIERVFGEAQAIDLRDAATVMISRGFSGSEEPTVGSSADADKSELTRITTFGDYELIEEIARGGMGVVYKARQKSLNRLVALKMILSGQFASAAEMSRFRLEAELAANLDHPNIVPIYEIGEHDGHHFFSMKYVGGGSLAREVPRLVKDPLAATRMMATIARAVHFAHKMGFLHCDLKPSNILIDSAGHPHVTDFGLARRVEADSSLTTTGALLGTPSYMAPEQASGRRKELTPAADVYGLGAIYYELLTGRPPFRAGSVMETVVLVLEREPESPRQIAPKVPPELEQICLKCLEKSPNERYASAEELAESLERFLRGETVSGTSLARQLRRWTRREPELVIRLGSIGLMIALTQYNYWYSPRPLFGLHYSIQAEFVLWALASALFQSLLRRDRFSTLARYAWAATDILALTGVLLLIEGVESPLLVGYCMLIATSGLWFRIRLVWFTTLLAIAGYGILFGDWLLRRDPNSTESLYPNIILAAIAVTGFVVARQVKRFWALSAYYESRPMA
jgi:serine/threonine-protein kinase